MKRLAITVALAAGCMVPDGAEDGGPVDSGSRLCPERDTVAIALTGIDATAEVRSRAAPSDDDSWSLQFPDGAIARITMPDDIVFAPPPSDGSCCDVFLPAASDEHREVQIYADDGLWFELSEPGVQPRPGFHSERSPTPFEYCEAGESLARRYRVTFDFAADGLSSGESVDGEMEGHLVRGFVARDMVTNERLPQATLGRPP